MTQCQPVNGHGRADRWVQSPLCTFECVRTPQAVEDDWYFQMYYDDLPVWGFIGKTEKIIKNQKSEFRWAAQHIMGSNSPASHCRLQQDCVPVGQRGYSGTMGFGWAL